MVNSNPLIFLPALIFLLAGCRANDEKNNHETAGTVEKKDLKENKKSGQETTAEKKGEQAAVTTEKGEKKPAWDRMFGGSGDDRAYCVQQTCDGGFVVAGYTGSRGAGDHDAWVIKLDGNGKKMWDRTYGGSKSDEVYCIAETAGGGLVLAGTTESKGEGARDGWVIKLDKNGNAEWDRTYGGKYWDELRSIQPTSDGGFIAAGYTEPAGAGAHFVLILKLDKNGKEQWSRTYSRSNWDDIQAVRQTAGGDYVAAGFTESKGTTLLNDAWVVKFLNDGTVALGPARRAGRL